MNHTDYPWWKPADVAQVLRVDVTTVYAALRAGTIPHNKIGRDYRIPAQWLRLKVSPQYQPRDPWPDDYLQLELPLDPACLVPVLAPGRRLKYGWATRPSSNPNRLETILRSLDA